MWAYRMFRLEPSAEYFDIIERAWLNVNLSSVSLDGLRFFYENMLRRTKKLDYELIWPLTRTDYLISYCCPPNIARMLAQSTEYAWFILREDAKTPSDEYSPGLNRVGRAKTGIGTGLYGDNTVEFEDINGGRVSIKETTAYPFDGRISFEIDAETDFLLYLRFPGMVV